MYTPAIDIWSIGCIFAEMLTGKPLFPGKNVVHQLDLMTDLLGTPPPECISKIRNEKARRYLSNMRKKPPVPFPQKFPNVDPLALRLLEGLLAFDPKDRPTAEEALANPYFNGLSNVECEPSTQPISKLEFEFERRKITKDDVRELIYREILEYHPQMLKEYLRGGEQTSFMYPSGVDRFKRQFAHLEEHYGKGERSTPLQRQHASLPRERVPAPKDETAAQSTDIERQTAPSIAKSLKSLPGSQQADGSEAVTVTARNGSSKPNYSNRSLLKSSSISASKCVVVKPKGDSERAASLHLHTQTQPKMDHVIVLNARMLGQSSKFCTHHLKGLSTFWSFTLGKRNSYLKGVVAAIFHHMGHGALLDTISAVRNKKGLFGIAEGMYPGSLCTVAIKEHLWLGNICR